LESEIVSVSKGLVITIAVILLAACQTTPKWYWHKDGASNQDYAQDEYPCLQEAQQRVSKTYIPPTAYEYTAAESSSGSVTNWGLFNSCMKARGWSKKYQQTSNSPQIKKPDGSIIDQREKWQPTTVPTTAQIGANRLLAQIKSTEEAFEKCIAPINSSPPNRRLEERFIFNPDDPRLLEKLTITGYATEQEIKDILESMAMGKPCEKQMLEGMEQVHPEFRKLLAKFITELYMDLAKVIKKELTVGEANERLLDRSTRMKAESFQLGQRIGAQLIQSHQN